ncbi:MAG: hypothetical protein K2L51_01420 [Clostridiales bacterium]|nr:hypothetical protein [Clostridiales bacterium]
MKTGTFKKFGAILLAGILAFSLWGCGKDKKVYDNENDQLVLSTLECDRVFNPFYSTSGTDSNIVGMTQLSMLSNDKDGGVAYGDNEAAIVKDMQMATTGIKDVDQITTYSFVLKNNVKFSNGSPLTMRDVLFNFYVYLDNAYTGSSTVYSTDIVGLQEYRTQSANKDEQDKFMDKYRQAATDRINNLVNAAESIIDANKNVVLTEAILKAGLAELQANNANYPHVTEDYNKAVALFAEELEEDYSGAMDSYKDMTFSDKDGNVYRDLFTTDVEVFLFNEGFISWNRKEGKLEATSVNDPAEYKKYSKEQAIALVYESNIPQKITEVVQYWNTANKLHTYITQAELEAATDENRTYKNISGIRFANRTESVTVNGTTYAAMSGHYDANGAPEEGYNEVLTIEIHNVDPKAIWNFAIPIAPLYYYSDAAHIDAFDYEENFGVEYNSQTFMDTVIKSTQRLGVPVGAGPYAASKSSGGTANVGPGDFYEKGIIYFERNDHYVMGPAKIKKLRYQVVSASQMLNSLYTNNVDFAEPNAKPETIKELNKKKGIGSKSIQTSGYGYIGINAGKVPYLTVRQAMMHAINTQMCVDYYQTTAQAIHRSMSRSNWAYPEDATPYYPFIGGKIPADLTVVNPDYRDFVRRKNKKAGDTFTEAEQTEFIRSLVTANAGATLGSDGVYVIGSHKLKYTFTVAGDEQDHPAWAAFLLASEILSNAGFDITVTTDANALRKLSQGSLTVWAAAWSSTIDPDMYQVYHKDSTASSVNNWGYNQIKINAGNRYDVEVRILDDLAKQIELGREVNDPDERKPYYKAALDYVMQLAVELPTYQRDDLFAYNSRKLDAASLTPDKECSSYKGLLSDIHNVSLIIAK